MSLRVGRVTLSDPLNVPYRRSDADDESIAGPYREKMFVLDGRNQGSTAQATMDLLERESLRVGAMWCESDNADFPSGQYLLEDADYEKPSGRPEGRPWNVTIRKKDRFYVTRQAEDDNVAGLDTADLDADEASKIVYTPTTSEVLILDPRNVAGAEKLNLPAGSWKLIARVYAVTNVSQKFRWKVTATDGTVLATGAQVAVGVGNNDAWMELDLGNLTVPNANDKANWFELHVQGVAAELGNVWLDYVRLVPA